jgi:Kef-type K+ transport system membrane component KefB
MAEFFELISFFGVAAFFAWLGYAPLQGQRILGLKTKKPEEVKKNLYKITDYFFISFLFFSIGLVCEYALHYPPLAVFDETSVLRPAAGTCFLFGLFMLFVPMVYIRTIGRGDKDFGEVNLPPFSFALVVTYFAAGAALCCSVQFVATHTVWGKILFSVSEIASIAGAVRMMQHWGAGKGWSVPYLLLTGNPAFLILLSLWRFL